MTPATRIALCGRMTVALEGRRVDAELPARQGRLLFAYLVLNRDRAIAREELIGVLWPSARPSAPSASLSVVLSRLRRCIGPVLVPGREAVELRLAPDAWVDVEAAREAAERARATGAGTDWLAVSDAGEEALSLLAGELMPGVDAPCLEPRRAELEDLRLLALAGVARAAVELGDGRLASAEVRARELVSRAPFREQGYRLLMEVYAAQGNVAEALQVYDFLRVFLQDQLGTAPAADVQRLHKRLLDQRASDAVPATAVAPAPPLPRLLEVAPELTGRVHEVARLRAARTAAVLSGPRLVLVTGEQGIGKTALVAAAAREAHALGAEVLYGRCEEGGSIACRPFVAALAQCGPSAALDDLRSGPGRPPDVALDVACVFFSARARARPLMLVLEDLQWSDRATVSLLSRLATLQATAPLLVVGTYRHQGVEPGHPLPEAAAYLCKERLLQRVHLTGLDAEESLALVEACVPGFDPVLAGRLHRRTGGNPYLLEELARGLAGRDGGASQSWLPETVTEVVRDRLARVSPMTRRVLQAAGAIGLAFSLGDVGAVTGLGGPSLLDALDEGVGAGVIAESAAGWFAFTPPVIRDVVLGAMTSARRDALRDRVPQDRAAMLMLAE